MSTSWSQSGTGPTRIKICGISDTGTALAAVEAGADAIGCVLAPNSPRTVSPGIAIEIASNLPGHVELVGVFVNGDLDQALLPWQPRWTQLHGQEDLSIVEQLSGPVIRAIAFDEDLIRRWDGTPGVDRLLVDNHQPGSGHSFDHDAFAELRESLQTPLVLAGGLTPDTVGNAIRQLRPWAVDVSSAVESSPGVKDIGLIREFCAAVRNADG